MCDFWCNPVRVLFLDYDGVIAGIYGPLWYREKNGEKLSKEERLRELMRFDPAAMEQLNRIIEETGAKVVVTSSRRSRRMSADLEQELKLHGFRGQVIGKTAVLGWKDDEEPHSFVLAPRSIEIQHYLDNADLDIQSFVILDDIKNMHQLQPRLVVAHPVWGLTSEVADSAIAVLKYWPYEETYQTPFQPEAKPLPTAQSLSDKEASS